jgi:phospholipid/cholesterol/gamma-HCH transport system permease protein
MIMARAQLGVGFDEFLDRLVKAVSMTSYLIGIGKAPGICGHHRRGRLLPGLPHQGWRRRCRPPHHTRRRSLDFLVIVADALFSIAFSALDL